MEMQEKNMIGLMILSILGIIISGWAAFQVDGAVKSALLVVPMVVCAVVTYAVSNALGVWKT